MSKDGYFSRIKTAAGGTSGSKRMMVIVPVAAVVAGGLWYMSSNEAGVLKSGLPAPDRQNITVQGGKAPTQEMAANLQKDDSRRIVEASEQGFSAIPTVQAQPVAPLDMPDEDRGRLGAGDVPQRPTPPVVERPPLPIQPPPPVPTPVQYQQAQHSDPDPGIEQARRFLEGIKPSFPAADVKYYYKGGEAKPDLAAAQAQVPGAYNPALLDPASGIKVPLPGTIVYAVMVSGANSDTPGPVVARIVTGDLAGSTLVGSFQTQREGVFISFQTMSVGRTRDGDDINKAIPVNAVAVDSKTVGTGIASDVDRHLLTNVGLTAAAAFMQGLGQAVATSGQAYSQTLGGTVVVNPQRTLRDQLYIGGGVGAGAAGQALVQAYGNRPPTVTVDAGTPVGILFLNAGTQR